MSSTPTRKFNMVYLMFFSCKIILFATVSGSDFSGHLKPLGQHGIPEQNGIVELDVFPKPSDFFQNFTERSRPVVFKNILRSTEFPAYERWTDCYLRERYGKVNVNVDEGKRDIRSQNVYTMPLSKYLNVYKKAKLYMVHATKDKLREDITVPISLQCGGLQDALSDVIVWFSDGGTRSSLHVDEYENINCLLDGHKMFVMIDKKFKPKIESAHYNKVESKSDVDVDSVDFEKFPWLREVPWFQVNLTKGDCLYIPIRWYHYVYSPPGRNLAINFWSRHVRWFNETDCIDKEVKLNPLSLEQCTIKGDNDVTDMEYFRDLFLKIFDDLEEVRLSDFMLRRRKSAAGDMTDNILSEVFEIFDTNHDMTLSMYEFYTLDLSALEEVVPDGDIEKLFDGISYGYGSYPQSTEIVITEQDDVSFLISNKTADSTNNSTNGDNTPNAGGTVETRPKGESEVKEEL